MIFVHEEWDDRYVKGGQFTKKRLRIRKTATKLCQYKREKNFIDDKHHQQSILHEKSSQAANRVASCLTRSEVKPSKFHEWLGKINLNPNPLAYVYLTQTEATSRVRDRDKKSKNQFIMLLNVSQFLINAAAAFFHCSSDSLHQIREAELEISEG